MRLIDADEVLQEIEESANAVEIQIHLGKVNKDVAKGMLSGLALVRENILRKPTAYDVEAVVAELEKKSEEYNEKADRHTVYDEWFTRYFSLAKGIDIAISIVRGKE